MKLSFEPLISVTLWLTLAVALAALLGWYSWRRPWGISVVHWVRIIGLMGLSAATLLVILLNPIWLERIPPPSGKPQLAIVVDDSASMSATDMPDGRQRFQVASDVAKACVERLSDRYEIQLKTFSKNVHPTTVEELSSRTPNGSITDLAKGIVESLQPNHPAGQAVLLLSDGNHNAEGGTARVWASVALARAVNASIFTRTFGSDATIHDLAIHPHAPQQLAFVGQSVPVTAYVRRRGRAPESVSVVLARDGQEVGRQQVLVAGDNEAEVRFQVQQPSRGLYRYEIRVDPFEGEVTQVNNYATFLLRVVDEPIRVLLVEGKPYWDAKFLARTLATDPSIELVCIIRMSENRYLERTFKRNRPDAEAETRNESNPPKDDEKGVSSPKPQAITNAETPVTESWRVLDNGSEVLSNPLLLGSFQVLVLGRDSEAFLSDQAMINVRNWVAGDSGALVCYRGQPMAQVSERLEKLLPVQWHTTRESRFRMSLTDQGKALRWFEPQGPFSAEVLPHLPTLATATAADEPKPLATILATVAGQEGEDVPVVTYQPYGGGRVVVVEGSGMWRWAFLPPAYAEHDATYATLWQSLLRWLVSGAGLLPGQDMALRADKVTFGIREAATATLLMRKEAAQGQILQIELTGDGIDGTRTLVPTPTGDAPGVYRVMFGPLPEGRYQARIEGQPLHKSGSMAAFDIRDLMEERLDLKARPDLMERIAKGTGGVVLKTDDPREIADSFVAHLEKSHSERIRRTIAWDRGWVFAATVVLWAISWSLRRHAGLV